jgi:hypothetical protein
MATAVKEPVPWDLQATSNESLEGAMVVSGPALMIDGIRVLGSMDDLGDQEWYRIDVPSGRHRVEVRVLAHEFGSVGDFLIERYDAAGSRQARELNGQVGWERDPWLEHRSYTAETIYLRIVEESGQHGLPWWYVVEFTLEEDG